MAMIDKVISSNGSPLSDFKSAGTPFSPAIVELIRHIARISAEQDYKSFLKTTAARYSAGLEKGPPQ